MFDLFGTEMPLAVRFFLAFLIVLGIDRRGRLGGAPVRQRADRRRGARTPAAARGDRLRERRCAAPAHSGAARQCRASGDDRRAHRRRRRSQYRARGRRPRATSRQRGRPPAATFCRAPLRLPEAGNGSWPLNPSRWHRSSRRAAPVSNRFPTNRRRRRRLSKCRGRSAKRSPPSPRTSPPTPTPSFPPRSRQPIAPGRTAHPGGSGRAPKPPAPPIRVSPKWRSGSKRRCANRKRADKPAEPRETSLLAAPAAETDAPATPPAHRRRRDPRGRPMQNLRARRPRRRKANFTTPSNRRWRAC